MGNHTSNGPTYRRMRRRKPVPADKETSRTGATKGRSRPAAYSENLHIRKRTQRSLAGQDAGFSFLVVLLHVPQQEQAGAGTHQQPDPERLDAVTARETVVGFVGTCFSMLLSPTTSNPPPRTSGTAHSHCLWDMCKGASQKFF